MMVFAQIFNEGMPWHVLSCPKFSGSYGTCLAREIKNGGKGGWTNFWPQCCFLSVTTMKWPNKELRNKCQMRDSEDLLHAKLGVKEINTGSKKKFSWKRSKKVKKYSISNTLLWIFTSFFSLFFFSGLKIKKKWNRGFRIY